jgi:hypothetical protein
MKLRRFIRFAPKHGGAPNRNNSGREQIPTP